jgi:hypothetical protein
MHAHILHTANTDLEHVHTGFQGFCQFRFSLLATKQFAPRNGTNVNKNPFPSGWENLSMQTFMSDKGDLMSRIRGQRP